MTEHADSSEGAEEIKALRARVAELERATADLERTKGLIERSREADTHYTKHLAALPDIAYELARTQTVGELCRLAVELGRSRLGFDRMGIWFRTAEPGVVAGSYGVGRDGQICDERSRRTKVDPHSPEGRILLSSEPFVMIGEAPVMNLSEEIVDHGSEVFAALWDGERVIGHISADNHLGNEPLLRHQCELVRLYGNTIGTLCSRKHAEIEREGLIAELKNALKRIKTLHGMLPICANCKKIRDDQGLWSQVEVYVRDHSDADFSHSLCPDCAHELYPELADLENEDTDASS
jgi:hypothetical protein